MFILFTGGKCTQSRMIGLHVTSTNKVASFLAHCNRWQVLNIPLALQQTDCGTLRLKSIAEKELDMSGLLFPQGPRLMTFFLYLTDGFDGGETAFTELGLAVTPKVGRAVLWATSMAHRGLPKLSRVGRSSHRPAALVA
eukprot:1262514-Amphidinium_carterae.2